MNKIYFLSIFVFLLFGCNDQSGNQDLNPQDDSDRGKTETNREARAGRENNKNLPLKLKQYDWYFISCAYEGMYDAGKYSKEQLENTMEYLIQAHGASRPFSIFRVEDLQNVNRAEVEEELNQTLDKLNKLSFISTPAFNKVKQKRISNMQRLKKLYLMELESYSNPKVLLNDEYSKNECSKYTKALIAGGDRLLALRKEMAGQSRDEGNQHAWNRYLEESKSADPLLAARVYVTTFGWWNCMNQSIDRVDGSEIFNNEYLKLFESISKECEQP